MIEFVQPCPFSRNYRIPKEQAWRLLLLFQLYRLLLAFTLTLLFVTERGPDFLGLYAPNLFGTVSALFLLLTLIQTPFIILRTPNYNFHPFAQIFIDIVALTLLMHASGGISSGIGILMIVTVTAGGSLVGGRCTLTFAALASIAVLLEQTWSTLTGPQTAGNFLFTGMLGMAFFAIAVLAKMLADRTELSQSIVRKQEIDLANLEQINEYVIQHLQSGILVIDPNGLVRMANESAMTLLKANHPAKNSTLGLLSMELEETYRDWLKQPDNNTRSLTSGHHIQFSQLGKTAYGTGNIIMIEDNSLISQRAQQIKLASLGRLTASIAHEIRNPLGAISHAAQLLTESPELTQSDQRLTEIINDNSARLNNVITTILHLSRRDSAQRESVTLDEWLKNFVSDFGKTGQLPPETFALKLLTAKPKVLFDTRHLEQIFENLFSNALAHGESSQLPAITIRLSQDNNRQVLVDVINPGPPIEEEIAEKLFEPFFTTSPDGTGLGLYISKELAELNHAHLEHIGQKEGESFFRLRIALLENPLHDA